LTFGPDDWARCRAWIEASAHRSPLPEPIEDIEARLAAGEYQFFPGEHSAVVTEIATFRDRKAMIVRYGGGDLQELLDKIEPALCAVAKAMGCDVMMSEGRKGWERAAEASGYRFAWVTMLKELT
jgi:hypothetical protein